MFEKDIKYFPTMREIRDQLIRALIHKLDEDFSTTYTGMELQYMKKSYKTRWTMLFDMANLGNLDKALTRKILANPEHPITRHILFLYSMESFIYGDLNKASRDKDQTKIKFYGAYAAALSYIIYAANSNKKSEKLDGKNTLYRGLKVNPEQITENFYPGNKIHLVGYTSTSKKFECALQFAIRD